MKIVVLDGYTLNPGDISWDGLRTLGETKIYDRTGPGEIVHRAADAEAIYTNKACIGPSEIDALPKLRFIGVLATGYNVVDIDYARKKGITVCNIPTYGTASVAQFVFALLLELCHHVGHHSNRVQGDAWAASDSDKGSGASRRMQGACHKHEHNGRAYGKACRKPHGIREELCKEDACKGRDHVPAKDVAGTGQRALRGTKDQHCRGPEGTYDEGQAHRASEVLVQKGNAAKGKGTAKPDLQEGNGVRGRKAWKDVSEKKCFRAQGHRPP